MRRIIAAIVLAACCFLAGCDFFTQEQEQARESRYENVRVDTNPSGPMLYSFRMSDDWDKNDRVVIDENWDVVFTDVSSVFNLIDKFKPVGTPESVVGMRIETANDEDDIETIFVDKTGRQLGGLDGHNIGYEIKNGHMVVYRYEGDYSEYYAGLYSVESETIVIPEQLCSTFEILDEELIYIRNNDGCKLVDYSGETVRELPGISFVDAYNYDGGGVLAASNRQEEYGDCNGLVDLEGNWLTETDYRRVESKFFGEYTLATKYALEYGEYGEECVLLDRSGVEYELDIPATNDWYYFYPMQEFAVVNVPNDGTYIVKSDRSVERIGDGWGSAIALGDIAIIETEEGTIVTDRMGNKIDIMEDALVSQSFYNTDKYVSLYDKNSETVSLYMATANGLENLDITDVREITPDGRFFVCRNGSAFGLKDIDGNWVYKEYLFNYLAD